MLSLGDIAWIGGGLLLLTAVSLLLTHRAEIAQAFDAFLMSRGGTPMLNTGPRTGPVMLVRGQQDQAGPELVRDIEAVIEFLSRHNLTDDELIAVYAVSHREGDDYPLSANKIREAVGGTREEVLAAVASHRPKPAPAKPSARLERPANGWGRAP